jgi:hypothetical protein
VEEEGKLDAGSDGNELHPCTKKCSLSFFLVRTLGEVELELVKEGSFWSGN